MMEWLTLVDGLFANFHWYAFFIFVLAVMCLGDL
jgi:hypothetical protein